MNEALNGIPLPKNVHVEGMVHAEYNKKVTKALQDIFDKNGRDAMTPERAREKIVELINKIRITIQNNPNVPINQLNF